MTPTNIEGGFDMALKSHLEENLRIKDKITERDEEIDRLRDQIMTTRIECDNYKHIIEIEKLKHMAEVNNIQTNFDIELQRLTSET
jgi:hypothetical protein